MKSKTERINCDNAKAASAALVRMHLCRFHLPREGERPREPQRSDFL